MSRNWTRDELQAASAAMKAGGQLSYEEFCRSISQQAPVRKKVWGHIGITFSMTEEEFRILEAGGGDAAELIFQKMRAGEYLLDGDTYFPPEDQETHWQHREDIELCL